MEENDNNLFYFREDKASNQLSFYTGSEDIGILEILSFLEKDTPISITRAVMAYPEENIVKESDFTVLKTAGELQDFLAKLFPDPDEFFFFYLDFFLVNKEIMISNHEDRDISFELKRNDATMNFMLEVFEKILMYGKKQSIEFMEKLQKLPDCYVETLPKSSKITATYKTFDDWLAVNYPKP